MSVLLLIAGFAGLIVGKGLSWAARRAAELADIRTSSIAAARGIVQISGTVRAPEGARILDPLGNRCVWYRLARVYDDGTEVIEGDPPPGTAAVDTILVDDGTGRCAMVLGKRVSRLFERAAWKQEGLTRLVILRLVDGTTVHAVGQVEKLARPDRGATHRIAWVRGMTDAYSHRSLETMVNDVPWMRRWAIGLMMAGAPAAACGLWLTLAPLFQ
jgi:hypothetical protein